MHCVGREGRTSPCLQVALAVRLLAAGADINQVTGYGWSPLLIATQITIDEQKLEATPAGQQRYFAPASAVRGLFLCYARDLTG